MSKPNHGLRSRAQVEPKHTYIICIAANSGGYMVESVGKGIQEGNLTDNEIMERITNDERYPLPTRTNPFDLDIPIPTKIVFHLKEGDWTFTETQFKLTKGSENETRNPSLERGPNFEFGGLGWVSGGAPYKTISVVDTHRRIEYFEYSLFLKIKQGEMSTIIEIDPRITNGKQ